MTSAPQPAAVRAAHQLAARTGFDQSCSDATGRLLQTLAARHRDGRLLEIGTGCGVGAAWIASGMGSGCRLHTYEADRARAVAVADVLEPLGAVEVHHGDWRTATAAAPVELAFVDARSGKWEDQQQLVDRLAVGGMVVMDDLTPLDQLAWTEDPVRDWWLGHPDLQATEVLVSRSEAVLLATRVRG